MPDYLRPSAKAVIVRDGALLVIRNHSPLDPDGEWLILPGGGQHPGEDLHATVRREVAEETGLRVEPGRLLWVREYIPEHHEFAGMGEKDHAIEFMFAATIVDDRGAASEQDEHQIGWDWVPIGDLGRQRLYPKTLVPLIASLCDLGEPGPVYLGDVN